MHVSLKPNVTMLYKVLCSLRPIVIAVVKQPQIVVEVVAYRMRYWSFVWSELWRQQIQYDRLFFTIIQWINKYSRAYMNNCLIMRTPLCSPKSVHKIDFHPLRIWWVDSMLMAQRYWTKPAGCCITSPNILLISVCNCKWNDKHHWLLYWCANNFSIV